jgi:hypothetical protein
LLLRLGINHAKQLPQHLTYLVEINMQTDLDEFKRTWRANIQKDPSKYIPPDQLKNADSANIEVSFAPDDAIEKHLSGDPKVQGGICCLVAVKIPPFGGMICVNPPGGDPDNMCIQ